MGKVQICGIDTATLPKISAKECDELLLKIKRGDGEARDLFCVRICDSFCPASEDFQSRRKARTICFR